MKKINTYKLLMSILCISLISSCSKEKSSGNIYHKSLNLTLNAGERREVSGSSYKYYYSKSNNNIPITEELTDKIDVYLFKSLDKDDSSKVHGCELRFEGAADQQIAFDEGSSFGLTTAKVYNSGQIIDGVSSKFSSGLVTAYKFFKLSEEIIIGSVIPGSGDKYIGIRIKLNDGTTHYGWIKINYSIDKYSVVIKEYAYNKIENQAIKAGEK